MGVRNALLRATTHLKKTKSAKKGGKTEALDYSKCYKKEAASGIKTAKCLKKNRQSAKLGAERYRANKAASRIETAKCLGLLWRGQQHEKRNRQPAE